MLRGPASYCYVSPCRGVSFSFIYWGCLLQKPQGPSGAQPALVLSCLRGPWKTASNCLLPFHSQVPLFSPGPPSSKPWSIFLWMDGYSGPMPSPRENKEPSFSGIRDFSFSTAAPSEDKDFWHVFKDVAAELSTSVLSPICSYDISSILYCSL